MINYIKSFLGFSVIRSEITKLYSAKIKEAEQKFLVGMKVIGNELKDDINSAKNTAVIKTKELTKVLIKEVVEDITK